MEESATVNMKRFYTAELSQGKADNLNKLINIEDTDIIKSLSSLKK